MSSSSLRKDRRAKSCFCGGEETFVCYWFFVMGLFFVCVQENYSGKNGDFRKKHGDDYFTKLTGLMMQRSSISAGRRSVVLERADAVL